MKAIKKIFDPNKLSTLLFYSSILSFIIAFNFAHNPPGGWTQQYMPNLNNRPLVGLEFTDSLIGYSILSSQATDTSFLIKSTNGGDDWNTIFFEFRKYNCFQFLNNSLGFIGGGDLEFGQSYLIKTNNGGENWIRLNTPNSSSISSISVLSEDSIWISVASGFDGGIFRTTNGGMNWTYQGLRSNGIERIYMYNGNVGFASSQNYMVRTTNSGINWDIIQGQNGYRDISFIDSLTGWKSYGDTMKFTTNGGLNWSSQKLPIGGKIEVSIMSNFDNINNDTLWGCGGWVRYPNNQFRGILYRSTNKGLIWEYQIPDTSINIGIYEKIDFVSNSIGWSYIQYPNYITGIHTTVGGDTSFITNIKSSPIISNHDFKLFRNYPNPFNPKTKISYELKQKAEVTIKVFDIRGNEIRTLVNANIFEGYNEVEFDGTRFSSGIYFYRMEVKTSKEYFTDSGKMILLK